MTASALDVALATGRIASPSFLDAAPLQRLLAVLKQGGDDARVVGGAVRNHLLGLPAPDIDITTTALPAVVLARAKAEHWRTIPTGIEHGTVTVVVDGTPFEVTTARQDVETDGRHAVVRFGRDFAADAARRDFTMNALAVTSDGVIKDEVGGLTDLAARRVRFIGDARQRLREDFLRILRFFRFHALYGRGAPDPDALAAIVAERAGLDHLSRERVRMELLKLLMAPAAAAVVTLMSDIGLLQSALAGVAFPARLARVIAIDANADAMLRLASLGVLVCEDGERLRTRLRLSNPEGDRLTAAAVALATLHGAVVPPDEAGLRVLLFRQGRTAARDALALAHAESGVRVDDPLWTAAHAFARGAPDLRLPFSGADLLARGLPAGRAVGAALKRLQALWIRAGFPRDPASLAALLDEALASRDTD